MYYYICGTTITGGNCCGQITARMCVSNKIPANYYYDDGFLEANWPSAKFIHLANVLYSGVQHHHAGACLSLRGWELAKRALGAPQVATFHTIHNNVAPNKSLGILLLLWLQFFAQSMRFICCL